MPAVAVSGDEDRRMPLCYTGRRDWRVIRKPEDLPNYRVSVFNLPLEAAPIVRDATLKG